MYRFGRRRFLEMSQKRLIVRGFVCIPKWSELHPVQQEARNRFYAGEYNNEVYHSTSSVESGMKKKSHLKNIRRYSSP